jgi:hypothetical protein
LGEAPKFFPFFLRHLLLRVNAHIYLDPAMAVAQSSPGDVVYDFKNSVGITGELVINCRFEKARD